MDHRSEPGRLAELVRMFVRLGVTAFGGPAAHIAMMHREVVEHRQWMSDEHFVDLIGATNLIPGPNSTEMTMHIGHHRAGWRGLVVGGASFILPAALIVALFAWAYVEYGSTPTGESLLYGVKPVIVAIVAVAVLRLGKATLRSLLPAVVGVTAGVAYLTGVNEIVVLFGGALLVFAVRELPKRGHLGLAVAPLALQAGEPLTLGRLFGVFVKVGAMLYGSGYVLLAFLRTDLVERLGVLTDRQLLDAIAVGQFTPGPVFTTSTFIGYVLAGLPGAVVATIAIFLPGFVFVALLTRILPHVRRWTWTAALLDGVNAAAIGLMAGVLLELFGDAIIDVFTGLSGAAALALLWRTNVNSAWLVVSGALLGIVVGAT